MNVRVVISLLLFATMGAACGGATTGGDAATDSAPGPEGSVDASQEASVDAAPEGGSGGPCPASLPATGDACSREGLACQYGSDPRGMCRPQAVCASGRWSSSTPTCPPISPPAQCPATRAMADGMSCTTMDQVCAWEGVGCTCTNCRSFPVGGCGGPLTWHCDAPSTQQGCPAVTPNLGSTCGMEGLTCNYSCEAQGIMGSRQCTGGVWVGMTSNCPISTRRLKRDVRYLSREEREALAQELLATRLATYEYTVPALAGRRRLGFLLEDQPAGSFAVDDRASMVDLYGYASMLAATVQSQQEQLDALRAEVRALRGGDATRSLRSLPSPARGARRP